MLDYEKEITRLRGSVRGSEPYQDATENLYHKLQRYGVTEDTLMEFSWLVSQQKLDEVEQLLEREAATE